MAITFYTTRAPDLQDARNLIERFEDALDPRASRLRDKLKAARDLLTEVENRLADGGCDL